MPWKNLEAFLDRLLEIENIRDIRLATKALMGLPQHWFAEDVVEGVARVATKARSRGVALAIHTHVNNAQSVTPSVARASKAMLEAGVRDVRNQGVLMRGVNDTTAQLLDLCFSLTTDGAMITPYYFYMCDMIPFSEHWRLSLAEAQHLQHSILGYLPGFATPRIVCDVPFVGKRWVHQQDEYDTERGISYWRKNYRTSIEGRTLRPSPASTSTTTRSTRFRRPGSSGGAMRSTTTRSWPPRAIELPPAVPRPSPSWSDAARLSSARALRGVHGLVRVTPRLRS